MIEIPAGKFLGKKGIYPGFTNHGKTPYYPLPGFGLQNRGTSAIPTKVQFMPHPDAMVVKRPRDGWIDIGAFEYSK